YDQGPPADTGGPWPGAEPAQVAPPTCRTCRSNLQLLSRSDEGHNSVEWLGEHLVEDGKGLHGTDALQRRVRPPVPEPGVEVVGGAFRDRVRLGAGVRHVLQVGEVIHLSLRAGAGEVAQLHPELAVGVADVEAHVPLTGGEGPPGRAPAVHHLE